jgi:sugar phosphate isomerase/epimerase
MQSERIILFTKSWKDLALEDLASLCAELSVEGVELPVREGYQVNPHNVSHLLKRAERAFSREGLAITSVASSLDKEVIRSMGRAGIPVLRILVPIDTTAGYFASVKSVQEKILTLQNELEANHVRVGIQNHQGYFLSSALGINQLLEGLPHSIAGAYFNFAHL